jgi:plasmid stabilization system protein ParE
VKSVVVRPAAAADIEEAFLWYEKQRSRLGTDFRLELTATLERIANDPELCQVIYRNTRRALLRRFPYGVFYRVHSDAIVVVAVMHGAAGSEAVAITGVKSKQAPGICMCL